MGDKVRALVKPDMLVWARETAGYDAETAAKKIGTSVAKLRAWEDDSTEDRPTMRQLRLMAKMFERPLAAFYLPEPPQSPPLLPDFRKLPDTGTPAYSPALTLEQRAISHRREQALELAEDVNALPTPLRCKARLDEDAEVVGRRIRDILGVSLAEQFSWKTAGNAFSAWRRKIEDLDVLVFQMSRVPSDEISGLALSHDVFPVIAVNRKNTPPARRTFSLLHEFAHLMLRQSGISDFDTDAAGSAETQEVEVWCNAVAAAALMPKEGIQERIQAGAGAEVIWGDDLIGEFASRFGVSREAFARRLHTLCMVSIAFYREKRTQYLREFREKLESDKARRRGRGGGGMDPSTDAISLLGRPFVRLALDTYNKDRITLSDVSSHLGACAVGNCGDQIACYHNRPPARLWMRLWRMTSAHNLSPLCP